MESLYQNMNQREAHALHLLHEYKHYMEFEFLMYKSDILMIDEGLASSRLAFFMGYE